MKQKCYFVYDPNEGFSFFDTEEDAKTYADKAVANYLEDEWDREVEEVIMGTITHAAQQVDKLTREEAAVDEHGEDKDGYYWESHVDYRCNYAMLPLSADDAAQRQPGALTAPPGQAR